MLKPYFRTFIAVFILCFALISQGCIFKKFGTSEKYNVMGAITHERKSYAPVEVGSLHLSSEEVISRQNFSGSKTTFLWGLFTFTDY
tara:strand:+ start:986 stop:1246 length:261 start_codon:yes stop_codon:yes gene_type:complete